MVNIARFVHALFYFWIFGIISVLLDLDHIIQVYQNGLEFNLENFAYHGSRTLHIPILILTGSICLITAALFIRFWNLNKFKYHFFDEMCAYNSISNTNAPSKQNNDINITANQYVKPTSVQNQPDAYLIECPRCNEYIGVIPSQNNSEFPCPYCGIQGFVKGLDVNI